MCWPYGVWTDSDEFWFQDHIRKCRRGERQPLTSDAWYKSLKDRNHRGTRVNERFGRVAEAALKRLVIENGMVLEEMRDPGVSEETRDEEILEEVRGDHQKRKEDKGKSKDAGRVKSRDAGAEKGKSKGKSKGKGKGKSKGKGKGEDMDMEV
jgi:flagellar biosynthesis/type III secretory pathway protein FliH